MALDGVIFDVDGTLIDSNDLHAEGWRRAFAQHGYNIPLDRIAVEIGKGGDLLVPAILGQAADQKDGASLRKASPREFRALAEEKGIKVFDGAVQLINTLRERGLKIAVATSSKNEHLDAITRACGVDWRKQADVVVTADDTDATKPAPDMVLAACGKLGMSPAQCAMVGDTIYDAEACRRAGVALMAVRTGYNSTDELRRAGARTVHANVGEILGDLERTLHRLAPASAHLTTEMLERLMREALAVAREALQRGSLPIGAVLADGDGTVLSRAHNEVDRTGNLTAHAEMVALQRATGLLSRGSDDLIMVSTLEPCVMCTGAAMLGSVDVVIYALPAPADSGTRRVQCPVSPEGRMPRIVGGVLAQESRALMEDWLRAHPSSPSSAYVRQLLELLDGRGSSAA